MQQPLTTQHESWQQMLPPHDLPEAVLKPYTLKQLASMYNVSTRSFLRWLVPFQDIIGKREGHFYNLLQVRIIFLKLGAPDIK